MTHELNKETTNASAIPSRQLRVPSDLSQDQPGPGCYDFGKSGLAHKL